MLGEFHGVLEQGVQRAAQALRVDGNRPRCEFVEAPRAWCYLRPAHEDIFEKRLELDVFEHHEIRLTGFCEQQQPLEDLLDPLQLVECDLDLRGGMPVRAAQDLEVATGDRHGCAQLVRRIVQELLLALEQ